MSRETRVASLERARIPRQGVGVCECPGDDTRLVVDWCGQWEVTDGDGQTVYMDEQPAPRVCARCGLPEQTIEIRWPE